MRHGPRQRLPECPIHPLPLSMPLSVFCMREAFLTKFLLALAMENANN